MSATTDEIKIVSNPGDASQTGDDQTATSDQTDAAATTDVTPTPVKAREPKQRSGKYNKVRSQVDKTRLYDAFSAIELIKRLSYSKFDGTITAHGQLRETGEKAEIVFPHSTGQSVTVAIADDKLLKDIEAGVIEFDILISTPDMMPKLAKHARVLGPKGLMPNPKNGTIVTDPEKAKKSFEKGKILVKTEKKAPLIHVAIGKTTMETKALVENLQALTKAFKGKLLKLTLAASMSPGVKVEIA